MGNSNVKTAYVITLEPCHQWSSGQCEKLFSYIFLCFGCSCSCVWIFLLQTDGARERKGMIALKHMWNNTKFMVRTVGSTKATEGYQPLNQAVQLMCPCWCRALPMKRAICGWQWPLSCCWFCRLCVCFGSCNSIMEKYLWLNNLAFWRFSK